MFEPKPGETHFEVSVTVYEGEGHGDKVFSDNFKTESEAMVCYNEVRSSQLAVTEGLDREVIEDDPLSGFGEVNLEIIVGDTTTVIDMIEWTRNDPDE